MLTRRKGDEWLIADQSALLEVPSVILPETFNLLLNPRHPDAERITILWHQPFPYDRRFFKGKRTSDPGCQTSNVRGSRAPKAIESGPAHVTRGSFGFGF